ncbi:hypothetical protein ZOSMA_2G03450 [Zostera marina]|uniref:Uncharacterized protein n=1 Tax=Zostera marina TaxID=29655 RepID=A0A0K9PB56_ZOSMR|nr:hypothetical protein ZOSMA_2G03450 [Zostera marina]
MQLDIRNMSRDDHVDLKNYGVDLLVEEFEMKKSVQPDFFYFIVKDSIGRLKHVFLGSFYNDTTFKLSGNAVTFNTTYKTNVYSLIFGMFCEAHRLQLEWIVAVATVEECVAPAEVPPRAGGRGRGVVPPVLWEPEMVAPLSIDCSEYIGSQNRRIPRRRRSGYPLAEPIGPSGIPYMLASLIVEGVGRRTRRPVDVAGPSTSVLTPPTHPLRPFERKNVGGEGE